MGALADFAKQYQPQLIGGLAGGSLGAGLAGLTTQQEPDEDPDTFRQRRLNNVVTTGLGGAALGATAPTVANSVGEYLKEPPVGSVEQRLIKLKNYLLPTNNSLTASGFTGVGGAGMGYVGGKGIGGFLSKMVNIENDASKGVNTAVAAAGKMTPHVSPPQGGMFNGLKNIFNELGIGREVIGEAPEIGRKAVNDVLKSQKLLRLFRKLGPVGALTVGAIGAAAGPRLFNSDNN